MDRRNHCLKGQDQLFVGLINLRLCHTYILSPFSRAPSNFQCIQTALHPPVLTSSIIAQRPLVSCIIIGASLTNPQHIGSRLLFVKRNVSHFYLISLVLSTLWTIIPKLTHQLQCSLNLYQRFHLILKPRIRHFPFSYLPD